MSAPLACGHRALRPRWTSRALVPTCVSACWRIGREVRCLTVPDRTWPCRT